MSISNANDGTVVQQSETKNQHALWTKDEVADYFRVTCRTVDRMIEEKKIPYFKLPGGRSIRFRASDIETMVNGGVS